MACNLHPEEEEMVYILYPEDEEELISCIMKRNNGLYIVS
jgi:hypothetical protein